MSCALSVCLREVEFDVTYIDEHRLGGDVTVAYCRFHAMPLIQGRGRPVRAERR